MKTDRSSASDQPQPRLFLWLVCLCFYSSLANADVFSDLPPVQEQIESLVELLPKSVTPGGERRITINGSSLRAKRIVTGDGAAVTEAMERLAMQHVRNPFAAPTEEDYAAFEALLAGGEITPRSLLLLKIWSLESALAY
jgi:hypothetical protein